MKLAELFSSPSPEMIDAVFIGRGDLEAELFEDRKWVRGRFEHSLGLDRNHGAGEDHAHIFGRKGNEIGVVTVTGKSSHGSKFKLHDADADALRKRGYVIPATNLVEWIFLRQVSFVLLG